MVTLFITFIMIADQSSADPNAAVFIGCLELGTLLIGYMLGALAYEKYGKKVCNLQIENKALKDEKQEKAIKELRGE